MPEELELDLPPVLEPEDAPDLFEAWARVWNAALTAEPGDMTVDRADLRRVLEWAQMRDDVQALQAWAAKRVQPDVRAAMAAWHRACAEPGATELQAMTTALKAGTGVPS
jgi:hypothetical protein